MKLNRLYFNIIENIYTKTFLFEIKIDIIPSLLFLLARAFRFSAFIYIITIFNVFMIHESNLCIRHY